MVCVTSLFGQSVPVAAVAKPSRRLCPLSRRFGYGRLLGTVFACLVLVASAVQAFVPRFAPRTATTAASSSRIRRMATFTKEIIKEGGGPGINVGQQVTVEANLYLASDGTAIWSTHRSSGFLFPSATPTPFSYSSGTGGVIRGWDDGVGTMKLGERAVLNIPWPHAYGQGGHPGFKIPPKSDLRFEIEVLKIS